jgi:hypothetical protein
MHCSEFCKSVGPIPIPSQISHRDSESARALMSHQIEQMILGAAVINAGNDVKDLSAQIGTSGVCVVTGRGFKDCAIASGSSLSTAIPMPSRIQSKRAT